MAAAHPVSASSERAGDDRNRWFAVRTQPHKERLALHHLANQRFETFCPYRRAIRRIGRRSITMLEPLFPSYVFVQFNPSRERWQAINGTIGVVELVRFGADPAALPDGFIEQLQTLAGKDGEIAFDEKLKPGERVRIMGGPLDALCGTLVTAEPRKRVTVLLELLSGATRVAVTRGRLVRA